ncbi:MAG: HNH endonuclease domain-containing protein [Bacteroidota bacterium]
MKIDTESFIRVSQILERDAKTATYKFALIKATIDAISYYDQHIIKDKLHNRVSFSMGLLVEQWLWYYYPLLESDIFLPQLDAETPIGEKGKNIAFRADFENLIKSYSKYGGFKNFYQSYKKYNLPEDIYPILTKLIKSLYSAIENGPIKYLGNSFSQNNYSIYSKPEGKNRFVAKKGERINSGFLINNLKHVSIPYDFYIVLKYMGGFIGGRNSIINNWADFIVKTSKNQNNKIKKGYILERLMVHPGSSRDTKLVESYYKKKDELFCVWSGKKIDERFDDNKLNVDHVLPFAHYLNNDIWNLLPALKKVNGNKSDKIPTPDLIEKRKDIIVDYWGELHEFFNKSFEDEVRVSLVPNLNFDSSTNWETSTLNALKSKAEFFIDVRGVEGWEK